VAKRLGSGSGALKWQVLAKYIKFLGSIMQASAFKLNYLDLRKRNNVLSANCQDDGICVYFKLCTCSIMCLSQIEHIISNLQLHRKHLFITEKIA